MTEDEDIWQCSVCGEEFKSQKGAVYHEKYVCEGVNDAREEEDEDICRGCGKEFFSREETEKHEETCDMYDSNILDAKRISSKRYPTLRVLVAVYRALGLLYILCSLALSAYVAYEYEDIILTSVIFISGIVTYILCMTAAESIQLMMDVQNNTYLATELNLAMAKSLDSIDESLKKKGD